MTKCRRCNRPLKNPVAIAAGIGPVCARKEEYLKERAQNTEDVIIPYNLGDSIKAMRLKQGDQASGVRTNVQPIDMSKSPTGFNFGYDGSGPACMALNIMLMFCARQSDAYLIYQEFKRQFVAKFPGNVMYIPATDIMAYIVSTGAEVKPTHVQTLLEVTNVGDTSVRFANADAEREERIAEQIESHTNFDRFQS